MTKNEVLAHFGDKKYGKLMNPYKVETYSPSDNSLIVVFFYYTHNSDKIPSDVFFKFSHDVNVTDDDLTPVIFKDGKVIGWGHSFYEAQKLAKEWKSKQ